MASAFTTTTARKGRSGQASQVNKVTWDTPDTEYLDLQPDGSYKAIKDGDARIRATADGFTKSIWAHVPAP